MKQVCVVGTGVGSAALLTGQVQAALRWAELVIGSARSRESVAREVSCQWIEEYDAKKIAEIIRGSGQEKIVVCMSGDSGFYSGTRILLPLIRQECEVKVLPGVSSLSYLAAKTGISWQDAHIISLHGRKNNLIRAVSSHRKTFVLPDGDICALLEKLCGAGLGGCRMIWGSRLSYPDENIVSGTVEELYRKALETGGSVREPLSAMFILNEKTQAIYPAGMPDNMFLRGDVPMTKSEVRAVTLSKLGLRENDIVYDIGAGTGSLSVEMAMTACRGMVYAIESEKKAQELIAGNRAKFMTENIEIVAGLAPACMEMLPVPNAAFVGGSRGRMSSVIKLLLEKNPGVRIVMNIISLESLAQVLMLLQKYGFQDTEIVQLSVSRSKQAGNHHIMEGQNPVYIVYACGGNPKEQDGRKSQE